MKTQIRVIPLKDESNIIDKRLSKLEDELNAIKSNLLDTKYIAIKEKGLARMIPTDDIIMIKSDSNYSIIYLTNEKEILTSKTLKHWSSILEGNTFLRVHASFLINRNHILEIKNKNRTILMNNNLNAAISRQLNVKNMLKEVNFNTKISSHSTMKYLVLVFVIFISQFGFAQSVGIGNNSPDNSSVLDITSDSLGVLLPRMTESQKEEIINPVEGLMIYQLAPTKGFFYYTEGAWQQVGKGGNEWIKDENELFTISEQVAIGINDVHPSAALHIESDVKGILIPRLSQVDREDMVTPAQGLLVYQFNNDYGFYFYNNEWHKLGGGGSAWIDIDNIVYTNHLVNIGNLISDTSAILNLNSTDKGILIPRMTTSQRNSILNPSVGLKIYNLNDNCEDTYYGGQWSKKCNDVATDYAILPSIWVAKNEFDFVRYGGVSFTIGNKIYFGTGKRTVNDTTVRKDFWEYDPLTDLWLRKADLPGAARVHAVGFSINGKGYIGTGFNGSSYLNDFWEYDPTNNSWISKANFIGAARFGAVGFSIGTKGYVGTGNNSSNFYNDFYEYDPANNAWIVKSNVPNGARSFAIGFSTVTHGYIGLGSEITLNLKNDLYQYTPSTSGGLGTWGVKENFPNSARSNAFACSIGTYALVGGGKIFGEFISDEFYTYNISTNSWTQLIKLIEPNMYGAASSYGDNIYLFGGQPTSAVATDKVCKYNYIPSIGQQFTINYPSNAVSVKDHDWISLGNSLSTTSENVTASIKGKLKVKDNIELGETSSSLLTIDAGGIQREFNGTPALFKLQENGGDLEVGADITINGNQIISGSGSIVPLNILGGEDAGLSTSSEGYLALGTTTSSHILIDNNEIIAKSNATTASPLFIQASGSGVTIGSGSTPTHELDVDGDAGKTGGGSWLSFSDFRLKKDIIEYNDGLSSIIKINPIKFRYNNAAGYKYDKEYVGVIAQDLQKISPYMVINSQRNAPDGSAYLEVDNSAMTYMLINAVKEQQTMIEDLKIKNEELKTTLRQTQSSNEEQSSINLDLKSRLEKLETLIAQINKQ